jgi:hypothetical protein
MSVDLIRNQAVSVRVGPFVDATTGVAPEVGIDVATADEAELLKANGAATVSLASHTWAAVSDADGYYDLSLTATDTNTRGELIVAVGNDSVCRPVCMRFNVVSGAF